MKCQKLDNYSFSRLKRKNFQRVLGHETNVEITLISWYISQQHFLIVFFLCLVFSWSWTKNFVPYRKGCLAFIINSCVFLRNYIAVYFSRTCKLRIENFTNVSVYLKTDPQSLPQFYIARLIADHFKKFNNLI